MPQACDKTNDLPLQVAIQFSLQSPNSFVSDNMKTSVVIAAVMVAAVLGCAGAVQLRGTDVCRGDWCSEGAVSPNSNLNIFIGVAQQNLDLLKRLHSQVSDITHPMYAKYLSHEELTALVAKPESTDAVMTWLNAGGVTPDMMKVGTTGEFIEVDAPAHVLNNLFSTKFLVFKSGEYLIARAIDAKIPSDVREHLDFILNLDDFPKPAAMEAAYGVHKATGEVSDTDELVTPTSLASYYNIQKPWASSSTKSSMAVFETQNQYYTPSDLQTFQQKYNIPVKPVANVTGGNQASSPGIEAQLDVQYIGATGLNVPLTFWYQGGGLFDPFPTIIAKYTAAVASDPVAPLVHSMSYGLGESNIAGTSSSTLDRINTEVQKMGVRGISLFVASGDSGVAGRGANSNPSACGFDPSWPASIPYVTSVGATQWIDGQQSKGETTCSIGNSPAALITSGGGFSTLFKRESYMDAAWKAWYTPSRIKTGQQQYEENNRGIPDVSALGHNYYIVSGGQFERVDGTSCATPAYAGMIALINDRLMSAGKNPVGWVTPALFNLAMSNNSPFNDITTGNNKCTEGICCSQGYDAVKGWDPATGIGTPKFTELANALMSAQGVPAAHPARQFPQDVLEEVAGIFA